MHLMLHPLDIDDSFELKKEFGKNASAMLFVSPLFAPVLNITSMELKPTKGINMVNKMDDLFTVLGIVQIQEQKKEEILL